MKHFSEVLRFHKTFSLFVWKKFPVFERTGNFMQ